MADNKNVQDGRDRAQIDGNSEYELDYVAQMLNVSREQVRQAIASVGNSREKVEEYLKKS